MTIPPPPRRWTIVLAVLLFLPLLHAHPTTDDQARIVGGLETPKGRYKAQVACYSETGEFSCGGTLIAPCWALSAAHCFVGCHSVRVNIHNRYDTSSPVEVYEIVEKYRHPVYGQSVNGGPANRYDAMAAKLDGCSSLTPMMLLSEEEDVGGDTLPVGETVTVTGWGATSEGGASSPTLQEVGVRVISNEKCEEQYPNRIRDDMLCAQAPGGGKDACQGDSGGPLFLKGADYESDVQVGVVSWGYGCAREEYPGVYARVTEFLPWLFEIMGEDKCDLRLTGGSPQGCLQGGFTTTTTPIFASSTTSTSTTSTSTTTTTTTNPPNPKLDSRIGGPFWWATADEGPTITIQSYEKIMSVEDCISAFQESKRKNMECKNVDSFMGRLGEKRDCEWVREELENRCAPDRARYCCPVTCGACGEEEEEKEEEEKEKEEEED